MANTSEIFSNSFESNISSEVNIRSPFLSAVETEADTGLIKSSLLPGGSARSSAEALHEALHDGSAYDGSTTEAL